MKLSEFDKCELKDGRAGWIVEVFGGGEAFEFELEKRTPEEWLITVSKNDIARKLPQMRSNP